MRRAEIREDDARSRRPIALAGVWIVLGLIIATFVVYADVSSFDFVDYDDNEYITQNPQVLSGISLHNIEWAFTHKVVANWSPLTTLSHMADCQLFHEQAGMHHLSNVLFHGLAALLLFFALRRATKSRWPSAFIAFMFAVHPLHVESVAWVSERKDVLSALFWFLAMYLYVKYTEHPTWRGYVWMACAFAAGLMAKPMLVTFPFTLLLLDVWPLHRTRWPRTLLEKAPLVALSAAMSAITYFTQTGAIRNFPWPGRVANALVSWVIYTGQTFWPSRLAVLYPYHQPVPAWQIVGSALLLVAVSVSVIVSLRKQPYLAAGWFWYLGTLVPVIGLVQVGQQAHADRYMYIPMIGLLIMLSFGAQSIVESWPKAKLGFALAAAACGIAGMAVARNQVSYWQNTGTLFAHTLEITRDNYMAEYTLGNYLMESGQTQSAIPHLEAAVKIAPNYPEAQNNLGMALGSVQGRMAEAIAHFETAVQLKPDLAPAQRNLAVALEQIPSRRADALSHYEIAERLQPSAEVEAAILRLRTAK